MNQEANEALGGEWGDIGDIVLCLLPLAFLICVTLSQRFRMSTSKSLPLAALMMWLIKLIYLKSPPNEVNAAVLVGALDSLTPLCIICGAILLFSTMQHTKCLPWIIAKIKVLSGGHPVAEVFLIGWAFAYLIEGASGFGTPVALAAPMLAEMGHARMSCVLCVLIMNTLATPYGAVGTPLWFGFAGLGLDESDLKRLSFQVSVIDGIAALIVPILAATFLVSWKDLWKSKVFVALSILSCVLPAIMLSIVSYEFCSIIGGLIGTMITGFMAQRRIGLEPLSSYALQNLDAGASPQGPQLSLLPGSVEDEPMPEAVGTTNHEQQEADSHSEEGEIPRRRSITVATLAYPHQPESVESFESAPGNYYGSLIRSLGPSYRNRLLFPITYDPVLQQNAKTRMVSVASQTYFQDDNGDASRLTLDVSLKMPSQQFYDPYDSFGESQSFLNALARTFPIWATVVLLVFTRVKQLGIKDILQADEPHLEARLGTLCQFGLSPSLVVSVKSMLGETSINWRFEALYVPFILPFVFVSCVTLIMFRKSVHQSLSWRSPFLETLSRIKDIVAALVGALVLVSLIRKGGNGSPAFIIGSIMATTLKEGFIVFAPILGALGSFFSGSTTVSNLTFGSVNKVAADQMQRSVTGMLALQCMGGTLGNMICINNIISAKAVLGLEESEGEFMKKTGPIGAVFYIIGTLAGIMFVL